MIEEEKSGVSYLITLGCDYCKTEEVGVIAEDRQECNFQLQVLGWRLLKKKHICPECILKRAAK